MQAPRILLDPPVSQTEFDAALEASGAATQALIDNTNRIITELKRIEAERVMLRRIVAEDEERIGALQDMLKERDATIAGLQVRSPGTNIMEATAPADRPREAVSQLRDICSWLQSEGEHELAEAADDLADDIARSYPEAV